MCCLILFRYTECLLKFNMFIAPAKPVAAKKAPAKIPAKKEESSSEEESSEEESSDEEEKAGLLFVKIKSSFRLINTKN